MKYAIIPNDYPTWHHCITVECGIELTANYIEKRLAALEDDNDSTTQQFVRLYGQSHRQAVTSWFKTAKNSL